MNAQAIGEVLAAGVGVALSPLAVVAIALILGTPSAKRNGIAFGFGWLFGLVAISSLVLLFAGNAADSASTPTSATVAGCIAKIALGALLLLFAAMRWRRRPRKGDPQESPKWMASLDKITVGRSFVVGALISGVGPKNLALNIAMSVSLATGGFATAEVVSAVALFVVIASITVVGPIIVYLAMGDRAAHGLSQMRDYMSSHNNTIMMVLLLVFGAKLIGDGLTSWPT
ncbi:MAG: GAP family protein [Candidatus Nanopelagicales bacterium]